jgi:hypothetical protein
MMMQLNLGTILVRHAEACYHLTSAVPQEYEASMWDQGDANMRFAALFCHAEAERWVEDERARKADRSCDQQEFYQISAGF